jgi:peptidoglycan/LPS O-acetylase OafA/YrhL
MLNTVSLLPAAGAIFIALICAKLISRYRSAPPSAGRFASIDGLRGYLAFFVFLHHSSIWYFYLKTGQWSPPPSNVYTNFGQASVALFFMITGFLFFGKLLDQKESHIDWIKIFTSRLLRLAPLYFLVVTMLVLIILVMSNFTLTDSFPYFIKTLMHWYGFTIFGSPDMNGISNTYLIVAGVTWSLPYEWLFYLMLPILAFCIGNVSSVPFLIMSFLIFAFLYFTGYTTEYGNVWHLSAFAAVILAISLVSAWTLFSSSYGIVPFLLLFLAFSIIAGGNTGFGIFSSLVSRTLGEMAYSIYLLHGLALFVLFNFVVGPEHATRLSAQAHWLLILATAPVLILMSHLSYYYIERPAMKHTSDLTGLIKTVLRRKKNSLDRVR